MERNCGHRWSQQGLEEHFVPGEILKGLSVQPNPESPALLCGQGGRSATAEAAWGSLCTWTLFTGPFLELIVEPLSF